LKSFDFGLTQPSPRLQRTIPIGIEKGWTSPPLKHSELEKNYFGVGDGGVAIFRAAGVYGKKN